MAEIESLTPPRSYVYLLALPDVNGYSHDVWKYEVTVMVSCGYLRSITLYSSCHVNCSWLSLI